MSWEQSCKLPLKGWKMGSSSNGGDSESLGSGSGRTLPASKGDAPSGESCGAASRDGTEDAGNAGNQSAGDESSRTAIDPIAIALGEALNTALVELDRARIKYLEAKAESRAAEEKAKRLEAAVAAMNGQIAPVAQEAERGPLKSEVDGSSPPRRAKSKNPRKKRNNENNPLAHLKCAGCGSKGSMAQTVIQAPSGAYVRMLVCGECNNQSLMG